MLFGKIFRVAIKSLFANKLRSFLAMLGIIIGVGAVIAMLSLAAGASSKVMANVTSLGTNLLVVRPGQQGMRGVMSGNFQTLTVEDAQQILQKVKNINQIAPVVRTSGQVKYFNKNSRTSIIGSTTTYFPIRNFEFELGRKFTEGEVTGRMRVAVLGPVTRENLFGKENPLGRTIKINRLNFEVIGVLKSKGDGGSDDQIVVPFTTAMKQLMGVIHIQEINIEASSRESIKGVQEDATKLLRQRHRIREDMQDDFFIMSLEEFIKMASDFSKIFTILLGGIASISLLVGGIGIMNIMLVTVTERTKEIGIRKAIGAKERHILQQFLLEAVLMTSFGGGIGICLGIGIAKWVYWLTEFQTLVETSSVILAITFSAGIGIFFGFYPARRAAKLDPIEALRYE